MTDISDTLPAPISAPGALIASQATEIERSRAVAEVQGAIIVAQRVPRNIDTCRTYMQESCRMPRLAEAAFFRYSRGKGAPITGPTVHLARELARCWGNIQYGIAETMRDDVAGRSEMTAFAWDVQTNTRSSTSFIVPHERDKDGGRDPLKSLRDIYENNANMGARRVRAMIYAVLPSWFTEEGEDICRAVLEGDDGKPKTPQQRAADLAERVARAVDAFAQIGVSKAQLEQKFARASDRWTVYDIAQLMITHRSLRRQEVTIEDEFPAVRVTVAEIAQQRAIDVPTAPADQPKLTDAAGQEYDPDDPARPM